MAVLSFRELIVWKKSMDLAKEIYMLTKKLPKDEIYGLSGQMRRCAVSIPSNIAEGTKRGTTKDYIQFLRIAHGSAAELETQLTLSASIYNTQSNQAAQLLEEVQKMLSVLIRKLSTTHYPL